MEPPVRTMWTYKGFNIYPAERNSSGIRWYCYDGSGICKKAETKEGMRSLINENLDKSKRRGS